MSEFKNFWEDSEFEKTNETEKISESMDYSSDNSEENIYFSEQDEVNEPEIGQSSTWNIDDFQTNLVKTPYKINETSKKPKFSFKKFKTSALAWSLVYLLVLSAFFASGFYFGGRSASNNNKNALIESLSGGQNTQGATQTVQTGTELSTVEISKKVGPSVVGITSQVENVFSIFGTSTTSEGSGSGIIISADGYIVTNNHVIDGATKVTVTLNTGSEYEAKVIGKDEKTDLAVIKIVPKEALTVAELGDSSKIQVGEKAVAIGNPLGLEFFGSTTQGIISAVNRTITVENKTMNVIQTDAAINAGNSGGALVNSYGQVIGINAVKISSSTVEGMGFAIPISEATPIISDLIQHGYVKGRPVIGISSRDVTDYMSARQGWPMGVQVMQVQLGSGAEFAGLEQGDIIFKADGKEIKTTDELNKIKDTHKPGDNLKLEVYKYSTGLNMTVNVKLGEERP